MKYRTWLTSSDGECFLHLEYVLRVSHENEQWWFTLLNHIHLIFTLTYLCQSNLKVREEIKITRSKTTNPQNKSTKTLKLQSKILILFTIFYRTEKTRNCLLYFMFRQYDFHTDCLIHEPKKQGNVALL